MGRHIALVEDDQVILDNYADFFASLGFEVDRYSSKAAALFGLAQRPPELVLLDISINGEREAGFDICAEIRRRTTLLPVIFLSSFDAVADRISGLRLGADDYVTKDVSLDYLAVRIEALFRRRDAYGAATTLAAGAGAGAGATAERSPVEADLPRFDQQCSTVAWDSCPLDLTLTQYWILHELCRQPGQVKGPDELMRAANITVEPNTIAAHVKAIRGAFSRVDAGFDRIRTERGRGYRWIRG